MELKICGVCLDGYQEFEIIVPDYEPIKICRDCVEKINVIKKAEGMSILQI